MKSRIWTYITAMAVFAVLAVPIRTAAQHHEGHVRYQVTNLGFLPNGSWSYGTAINNRGWVMGESTLQPGGQYGEPHATVWRNGVITDLGTLGGPASGIDWPQKNDKGLIAVVSQTANIDPNNENFCGSPVDPELTCLGAVWQNGVLTALPTLGGTNGYPGGVNNRGQIVGAAETSTQDPTCAPPQVLDFEAVIWGPKPGQIQALPPFPGDSVGVALGINDKGQVVGVSGSCGPYYQGNYFHALLWQEGKKPKDLGNLGGRNDPIAISINNRGKIVGFSFLADDVTNHAFLWTSDKGMQDLGTLPGDLYSVATEINDEGQAVGASCDARGNCRAFFWEDGVMTDLNTLVCPGTSLYLTGGGTFGPAINDRGEITGQAYDPNTGDSPAYVAVPTDECEAGSSDSSAGQKIILPESVREQLRRRKGFGRFGAGLMRHQ